METLHIRNSEKLYALSLQSLQARGNTVICEHSAFVVVALSFDDAEGQGMDRARTLWPTANGWEKHDASAIEVIYTVRLENTDRVLLADEDSDTHTERIM